MPFTFAAFLVAALSIVGLPPLGGVWSKWYLVLGALDADQIAMVAVLMISSVLSLAYLLPIPFMAFFGKAPDNPGHTAIKEAPLPCLIAIALTTIACVLLFFFPTPLLELVERIDVR